MGWDANKLTGKEVLIIGTQGGIRAGDGRPVALGYHTGHWEIGMQMQSRGEGDHQRRDPVCGLRQRSVRRRSQGTHGMFDSLPYRNDAAIVFSSSDSLLPTRRAVIGVATCDKGLPATMIALASMHNLPPFWCRAGRRCRRPWGRRGQGADHRRALFANHELSLQEAAELGCRLRLAGRQVPVLGTAGTSQVVAEALGLALPHSALAPSGQAVWLEIARQSARAVSEAG